MSELSGRFALSGLLECAGLARSTYYYALAHPKNPTRPELWDAAREIFSRTPNGCGHRQIAMCLRAERGAVVADKTVLKMMGEMGLRCGIRRETDYHRYNSYKGVVGETFENVIGRDFAADGPWQKMGTDVTEFKVGGTKLYLSPVVDLYNDEVLASIHFSPFRPTHFHQSRHRCFADRATADAPLPASPCPPSRRRPRATRPSGGRTARLSL